MQELTIREKEVLELILLGFTNEKISRELAISVNTTKVHIKRICEKLVVKNRIQAAVFAVKKSLNQP